MVYADIERARLNNQRKYERIKYTLKRRAREKLRLAVYSGKIIRPEFCSSCNTASTVQGHHEDYNKPYEVTWLCPTCHRKVHKELFKISGSKRKDYRP